MASPAKQQRVDEETAHEPSLAEYFSAEILNLIALALTADADVLIPRHIGSLARTCKCIKDAVQDANDKLREKHRAARALCNRCGTSVDHIMVDRPTQLNWDHKDLVPSDAPALTNVLKSKAMAQVQRLHLFSNKLGVDGGAAVAAAAAGGGLPRLTVLNLHNNDGIGDTGIQALASAFAGGAFSSWSISILAATSLATPVFSPSPRHSRRVRCRSLWCCTSGPTISATKV